MDRGVFKRGLILVGVIFAVFLVGIFLLRAFGVLGNLGLVLVLVAWFFLGVGGIFVVISFANRDDGGVVVGRVRLGEDKCEKRFFDELLNPAVAQREGVMLFKRSISVGAEGSKSSVYIRGFKGVWGGYYGFVINRHNGEASGLMLLGDSFADPKKEVYDIVRKMAEDIVDNPSDAPEKAIIQTRRVDGSIVTESIPMSRKSDDGVKGGIE